MSSWSSGTNFSYNIIGYYKFFENFLHDWTGIDIEQDRGPIGAKFLNAQLPTNGVISLVITKRWPHPNYRQKYV